MIPDAIAKFLPPSIAITFFTLLQQTVPPSGWTTLFMFASPAVALLGTAAMLWWNRRQLRFQREQWEAARDEKAKTESGLSLDKLLERFNNFFDEVKEFYVDQVGCLKSSVEVLEKTTVAQTATLGAQSAIIVELQRRNETAQRANALLREGMTRHALLSKPRVLYVEDNDDQRALVRRVFDEEPLHMDVAADGTEALRKYREAIALGIPYALIILDYSMPMMNGEEIYKEIRDGGDELTHFIFYTAYPDAIKNAAGVEVLAKGCPLPELKATVWRNLGRKGD